jgi:plastocyanin
MGHSLFAGLLGLGLLTVCAPAPGAQTVEVQIRDYRFEPATVTIRAGDTVRWINAEKRVSHSVYFTSPALESERLFPGEAWSRTFPEAGRQPYRCGPHPEMEGMVVVE